MLMGLRGAINRLGQEEDNVVSANNVPQEGPFPILGLSFPHLKARPR